MAKAALVEIPTWEYMFWPLGVPRYIEAPSLLIQDGTVGKWARTKPQNLALTCGEKRITYSELDFFTDKVANELQRLEPRPSSACFMMDSGLESVIGLLSALKAGLQVTLPSKNLPPSTFDVSFASESQTRGVGIDAKNVVTRDIINGWVNVLSPPAEIQVLPSDPALKMLNDEGVELTRSHECYLAAVESFATFIGIGEGSVSLLLNPLHDELGVFQLLTSLCTGGLTVLPEDLGKEGVTRASCRYPPEWVVCGADLASVELLAAASGGGPKRLRCFLAAADRMSAKDQRDFERETRTQVLKMYHSVEVGSVICEHPSWTLPGSVGIPIVNVEARVAQPYYGDIFQLVDPDKKGEILVSGPMIDPIRYQRSLPGAVVGITGYTTSWFRIGVSGELDHNGLLYLGERVEMRPFI